MNDISEQISTIMRRFDWSGCRQIMLCLGWRWGIEQGQPSISELRSTAREMMERVAHQFPGEPFAMTQTGGFSAIRVNDRLDLIFGFTMKFNFDWELWPHLWNGGYRNWEI